MSFYRYSVSQLIDMNYCPPWWVQSAQVMGRCLPSLTKPNNTETEESSNAKGDLNLAMDQDNYKKRLREIRVSREELKYLILMFHVELVEGLGSQGVEIQRKVYVVA